MGLDLRAVARGTNPDHELSPQAVEGLMKDGLAAADSVPQKLTQLDVQSARQVVSFCELPGKYQGQVSLEHWEDIPPVSENYEAARDVILEHIYRLVSRLK